MKNTSPFRQILAAFFAVLTAIAFAPLAHPQENLNVGLSITALDDDEGELLAWYPSASPEKEFHLDPFKVTVALDGKPAAGKYPVILFSHGVAGHARNHWQTAADLARAGNIVLAPQHESDWHPSLATRVENRAAELRAALARIKNHPALRKIADATKIGAVGYSLGGMSVLFLAGGAPSIKIIRTHCARENRMRDPEVCITPWWRKAYNIAAALLRGDKPFFNLPEPTPLKAVALAAPVGVLFGPNSFEKVDAAISIHRFGDDRVVRHPFHAEHLRGLLKVRDDDYHVHDRRGILRLSAAIRRRKLHNWTRKSKPPSPTRRDSTGMNSSPKSTAKWRIFSGGHSPAINHFPPAARICGKRITSRMDGWSVKSITNRSTPIPPPALGGRPYCSART